VCFYLSRAHEILCCGHEVPSRTRYYVVTTSYLVVGTR
jgi:hypothetical protein